MRTPTSAPALARRSRAVLGILASRGPLAASDVATDPAIDAVDGRDVGFLLCALRAARLVRSEHGTGRRLRWAITEAGREEAARPDVADAHLPACRFGPRQADVLRILQGGVCAAWAPDHRRRRCRAWVVVRRGEALDGRVVRSLRARGLVAEVRRHAHWHEYALSAEGEAAAAQIAREAAT